MTLPPDALRLTTMRIGETLVTIEEVEDVHRFDVRIVQRQDGRFCFIPDLDRSFATLDEAMAAAGREVGWRPLDAPLAEGEQACPICAAPVVRRDRYPRRLCPACHLEATDARGRAVQFGNTTPLGMGFQGRYRETGVAYDGADCWVRGVACRAEEDRFGGIVIQTRAT